MAKCVCVLQAGELLPWSWVLVRTRFILYPVTFLHFISRSMTNVLEYYFQLLYKYDRPKGKDELGSSNCDDAQWMASWKKTNWRNSCEPNHKQLNNCLHTCTCSLNHNEETSFIRIVLTKQVGCNCSCILNQSMWCYAYWQTCVVGHKTPCDDFKH